MDSVIRLAESDDAAAISRLVHVDRFRREGSGTLLAVSPDQVLAVTSDARLGAFYVAQGEEKALSGCVSVLVYGLPDDYNEAMTRLRGRLTSGTFAVGAGLKMLAEGALLRVNVAELRSLVVGRRFRGRGLGAQLIEEAKVEAARRGFKELYSLINERVFALFERSGFARAERTPQKLVMDCATCPILERCNEVPVVARL